MSRRPRLLFLNRSYWPDAEATGQLLTELCEDLAERFDVTVVAGQPNWNAEGAGFQRRGVQCRAGVTIRRVRHTRFAKRSVVGRVLNQLTFFAAATFAALALKRPDIVVVETDPPFLALLGTLARRRFGCPLVVYLQDIYPDVAVALGKLPKGFPTNLLHRWLHGTYRRADQVIVLSQDMRATLRRSGVAEERIAVVPNWADAAHIYPIDPAENHFRQRQQLNGQFVVMYSGNMGLTQRLDQVLLVADSLRNRRDLMFLLIGGGTARPALERQAADLRLPNVRFLDYQPQSELPHSLSAADIHLLPVDPRVVPCPASCMASWLPAHRSWRSLRKRANCLRSSSASAWGLSSRPATRRRSPSALPGAPIIASSWPPCPAAPAAWPKTATTAAPPARRTR